MEVKILNSTNNFEQNIITGARMCYNSKSDNMGPKDIALLKKLINLKHLSVLEHSSITFLIKGISRSCLAQLTRHRIASYSVMSMRYVDYSDRSPVIPSKIEDNSEALSLYQKIINKSNEAYNELIDKGINKEDARFILPIGSSCDLVLTMNARSLLDFFSKRLIPKAQWEIRELAKLMKNEAISVSSLIFGGNNE